MSRQIGQCRERRTFHQTFVSRPLRRNPRGNPQVAGCLGVRLQGTHLVNQDYHQVVGAVWNGAPHRAQVQAVLSRSNWMRLVHLATNAHLPTTSNWRFVVRFVNSLRWRTRGARRTQYQFDSDGRPNSRIHRKRTSASGRIRDIGQDRQCSKSCSHERC